MADKFNIVFIVGVEGSGHHLYQTACNFDCKPPLKPMMNEYFDTNTNEEKRAELKQRIQDHTRENIGKCCRESASFPYGRNPFSPMRYFDIFMVYDLFNLPHVNLFIIVTTRDPVYSTLSTRRRFDGKKPLLVSARVQEMGLITIATQLQQLPPEKYMIAELKSVINNAQAFEKMVRERSGFTTFKILEKKLRPSDDEKYVEYENYEYVRDYFADPRRRAQWKFLTENAVQF